MQQRRWHISTAGWALKIEWFICVSIIVGVEAVYRNLNQSHCLAHAIDDRFNGRIWQWLWMVWVSRSRNRRGKFFKGELYELTIENEFMHPFSFLLFCNGIGICAANSILHEKWIIPQSCLRRKKIRTFIIDFILAWMTSDNGCCFSILKHWVKNRNSIYFIYRRFVLSTKWRGLEKYII